VSQPERFDPESQAPGAPAMPTLRGESRAPAMRPRPSRARIAGRLVVWSLVLAVVALFAAYGLLPALARERAERWLAAELSRPVSIERLRFHPFTLVADLETLRIGRREGEGTLLTVARAHVDFAWTSLRRRGPVIERLQVERPVLVLERDRGGDLNIADIQRRWREPAEGAPAWLRRFSIANIEIDDGSIILDDAAVGQKHRVESLALKIPFLSSLPVHGTIDVEPSLSAIVNGAPFSATGQVLPFADDRSSTLTIDIGTSDLLRYVDYLPMSKAWRIGAGQAAARLVLDFRRPVGGEPALKFSGALAVAGLEVVDADGRPLLSLPGASVELLEYDMQAARLRIGEVMASGPRIDWRQASPDDAPAAGAAGAADRAPGLDWSIAHVGVVDGRLRVDARLPDGARIRLDASDLRAEVDEVSSDGALPSRFRASASFGPGEALEAEGRFSHAPLLVSGRFEARGVRLERWMAPFEARMPLRITQGSAHLSGGFEYGWRDGGPDRPEDADAWPLQVLAWKSRFAGLRFEPSPGARFRHVQSLDALAADGLSVDFVDRRIGFTRAHAEGLALAAVRGADGTVDLAAFLEPLPGGWWIEPGEFSLGTAQLRLDDESGRDASHRVEIAHFSLGPRREDGFGAVSFDGRVGDGASLAANGRFAVNPLRLVAQVEAHGFSLAPWRERIDFWQAGRVAEGTLEARGELAYEAGQDGNPAKIAWDGAVGVTDLRLETSGTQSSLLRIGSLRTDALRLRTPPLAIDAGELAVEGLHARFEISPGGEFGLVAADGTPVSLGDPGAGSTSPEWRIAGLRLADARIDIDDLRDADTPALGLTGLAGTVGAIAPGQASELALTARLEAGGEIGATGRARILDPLALLEFDASLGKLELERFSPLARRYLGHALEGGRLDAQLQYRVRDRRIEARHELVLREPVFGASAGDSADDAPPLDLALALLRDAKGTVELSLPVTGSLDDPDFSLAAALAGGFRDQVARVADKPFERLARLVNGSAERLEQVGFAAGSSRLGEQAVASLGLLARALAQRPGLELRIAGLADAQADRDALAQHQFERMLKARKVRGQGGAVANLDAVTIGRGEYPVLVDALFRESSLPLPTDREGRPRDIGVSEKAKALLATVPVGDSQLRDLAQDRAQAVRDWLAKQGGLDPSRLSLGEPVVGRAQARSTTTGVEFRIGTKGASLARPGQSS
jgi:outer membrane protein OmpA-like peptidoglycan-associated protein